MVQYAYTQTLLINIFFLAINNLGCIQLLQTTVGYYFKTIQCKNKSTSLKCDNWHYDVSMVARIRATSVRCESVMCCVMCMIESIATSGLSLIRLQTTTSV